MHSVLDMNQRRVVAAANYNSHNPGERHYDRVMPAHDLLCILEGSWELCQAGESHILNKGDVILLHAGLRHFGGEHAPGVKTMYIHFDPLPEDSFGQRDAAQAPPGFLAVPVVARTGGHTSRIALFEKIIVAFWSESRDKSIRLSALLDELLLELAGAGGSAAPVSDAVVEQALYDIHITPGRFLKIEELAESLHVSKKSLTQRFKAVTKKTVHDYQMNLKLEMAEGLIREDPNRPFKEVARNLGFYDEFHFSRHFKTRFGVPPSALKKRS